MARQAPGPPRPPRSPGSPALAPPGELRAPSPPASPRAAGAPSDPHRRAGPPWPPARLPPLLPRCRASQFREEARPRPRSRCPWPGAAPAGSGSPGARPPRGRNPRRSSSAPGGEGGSLGDPESSVWRAVTAQPWLPVLRAEARTSGFQAPSHDSPGAGPSLENATSVVQESLFPWDTVYKAPVSLAGSGAPSSEITLGLVPVAPRDPSRRPGSPLLQVSRSVLLFLAQTTSTLTVPWQASEGIVLVLV